MDKTLSFSVDKIEVEKISNAELARLRMFVCHDKFNKNGSYISLETLKKAEPTLLRKPILYKYSEIFHDFEGHGYDNIICGYIPEVGNNISYQEINGKTYLVVDAIIWSHYCSEVIDVFLRDGEKDVSIEIKVLDEFKRDDGYIEFTDFVFQGVCLLGQRVEPGMFNTTSKLLRFSKIDSNKFEDLADETNNILKMYSNDSLINLTIPKYVKDAVADGLKYLNELNMQSSSIDMGIATYLLNEDVASSEKLKYIANNFPDSGKDGSDVSFMLWGGKKVFEWCTNLIKLMEQNQKTLNNGYEVFEFDLTKKEDREMAKPKKEIMEKTQEEIGLELKEQVEGKIEGEMAEQDAETAPKDEVIAEEEMGGSMKIEIEIQKNGEEEAEEPKEEETQEPEEAPEAEKQEDMGMTYEEMCGKYAEAMAEMEVKNNAIIAMEQEIMAMNMAKAEMAEELESLRMYKKEKEDMEKKNEMSKVFSSISNQLTKEEIDDWSGKIEKYENIEMFSKDLKSYVCDKILNNKTANISQFSKMAIDQESQKTDEDSANEDSLWNRISKIISQ